MNKLLFLLISIFISVELLASERDSLYSHLYELDEIVIQSIKQDKSLKELPTAVSRISRGIMTRQQLLSTKDLNGFIPNLFIPDYGSKYTSPVFIRGIGSKNGTPSVGLYVDGIPYFEKSAFDFDLSEIESIDVYRGPQGTLYGRNTMGGLIHITTCSPLKHQRTQLHADGGSYNQYKVSGSHYGKVNERLGYAVSGKYQRNGGFFTNTYKGEKADKTQSGVARLRMEWMIRPDLKFSATTLYDRSVQGANAYGLYDADSHEVGSIAFNGSSYYHRTLSSTGVGLNYQRDRFQLSYQQSLQYTKDKLRQDQDFTTDDRVNSLIGQEQLMTSGELTLKNQLGRHYRGLTGAFVFYQHVEKQVNTFYQKYNTYKNDDVPTTGVAVYHQSVIEKLGVEGLSLTLGLRYDYERATRDFSSWKKEETPKEQHTKQHFSQWVPKAVLQYLFPNKGQIYASVAKGYKTGGFNTSFMQESEKVYKPESSWNYEIGAKHPFWNRRFNAEVALFWIDWSDQHVQQRVDTGGFMIRNAGKTVSKGVELSMQCNPFNGLMIHMNYGYTHAQFKRYQYSKKVDYAGKYLPMVPRHTVSGSMSYGKPVKHMFFDRYQVTMNFTGNGKTYWHEDNQMAQPFYVVLNAAGSLSWEKVTVGLWAKNLTNTHYMAYLFKASSGTFAQPGKPFTIGANITLNL